MKNTFGLDDTVIPIYFPSSLVRWLESEGYDRGSLIDGTGLVAEDIDEAQVLVSFRQHRLLISNALELTNNPHLGIPFGKQLEYSSMGIVGFAAMTSKNLHESIKTLVKYMKLRAPLIHLDLEIDNKVAHITIDESIDYGPIRTFMHEGILGSISRIVEKGVERTLERNEEIIPGSFSASIQAELTLPEPPDWEIYKNQLAFPVKYSQPVSRFSFPAHYLEQKSKLADPATAKSTKEICDTQLKQLEEQEGLISRINGILLSSSPNYPSLNEVASQLCVSSRTLRRELAKLDTSYQTLLDEYRERISIHFLRSSDLSVQEIAGRIGYKDPANFGRAFRKWTGKSPGSYRK